MAAAAKLTRSPRTVSASLTIRPEQPTGAWPGNQVGSIARTQRLPWYSREDDPACRTVTLRPLDWFGSLMSQPAVQVTGTANRDASWFDSGKAKPSIIRRPTPVRIAQNWLKESRNLVEKAAAFLARQRGAERIGERVQPPAHSGRQRRGASRRRGGIVAEAITAACELAVTTQVWTGTVVISR
jgi:hypothetical protein